MPRRNTRTWVIVGIHGRNPIDLALFGSTTNQLVRCAPCPVLTMCNDRHRDSLGAVSQTNCVASERASEPRERSAPAPRRARERVGESEGRSPSGKTRIDTMMLTIRPIGFVRSGYRATSEVPKGLGTKHDAEGVLEILPEFDLGLTDIEGFSHLYVIWAFDRSEGFELLGTPPSDNRPHGVFATRSPRRPNPIGVSVVELLRRDGRQLHVRGIDMLDATPILDIKPYLSSVPIDEVRRGWLAEAEARQR